MARERFAAFNVVAAFPDMAAARGAIDALQRRGVDGNNISLLGRAAEEVRNDLSTEERDAGVAKDVSKSAAIGTAAGVSAGALAGLVGGLVAFGIPGIGPAVGTAIWATTLGGAGVGAAIGGLVGGTSAISTSPAWGNTFKESIRAGRVLVGVHADTREEVDSAVQVLRDQHPLQVDYLDPQGQPVSVT